MKIVPLSAAHFDQWQELYAGYAEFYKTPLPTKTMETVWQWLNENKLRGLCAEKEDNALAGIAHWAPVLRPLHGAPLGYLHDLFVIPQARGAGVGAQLVAAAARDAHKEGCAVLRWATAADNQTAMRLYDRIAKKTKWVIYEQDAG